MTTRIFYPAALNLEHPTQLDSHASNHLANVLRVKPETPIVLFNGQGGEYHGSITQVEKKSVTVFLTQYCPIERESALTLELAQVISRGKKMDLTIQKAVELGVNHITPLISERCGVKLTGERWEKKCEHWQKIILSACEQCGRNTVPTISTPMKFLDWLPASKHSTKVLAHPSGERTLHDLTPQTKSLSIVVGPEGGFTEDEIILAQKHEFVIIGLGKRILRTETAGLALLSIAQHLYGDL